ncbi:hypothetical protein SB2_30440, partial [Methylobacterium radiotolerans]
MDQQAGQEASAEAGAGAVAGAMVGTIAGTAAEPAADWTFEPVVVAFDRAGHGAFWPAGRALPAGQKAP